MARRTIVILRLVRIGRARGVTFVLVHHQMMLAAGALVRSVLAAGAVCLAWHARAVLGIYDKRMQKSHVVLLDVNFKEKKLEKRCEYTYEKI